MKIFHAILLAGLGLSMAVADVETRRAEALGKPMETFRTLEGRVYEDVVITKINAGGVSFKHADGAARLRFDELSPGQRKYFGIDEETAAEVYRKEAEQRAAYEALVAERAEERRAISEKKAEEREEAWRIAMAEAAAERAITADPIPSATIPDRPTIQRVDSRVHRSRSYRSGNVYYGGFYGYSGYQPSFHRGYRHGGYHCATPSIIIRR